MVAGGGGVVVTAAVEVPAAVEVVARALGFGHAAAEAVGLGREHEAAARGAVPVAGAAGRSGALAVAAAAAPAAAEAAIAALLIVLASGAGWGGRQRRDIWDNGTLFGTFFRACERRLFVARRNRGSGGRDLGNARRTESPAPSGLGTPQRKQLDLDANTFPHPLGHDQSPGLTLEKPPPREPPPPRPPPQAPP